MQDMPRVRRLSPLLMYGPGAMLLSVLIVWVLGMHTIISITSSPLAVGDMMLFV